MAPILPENVHWSLRQVHGDEIFEVNTTNNFMVGRCKTAQIILNSNKTSRIHSSLVNIEGHLLVQDLNSVNGTYINGTQISVYVLHRLSPGDTISFGVADLETAENDRDRLTFFVVIREDPPVQNIPPIEGSFANSTTDPRENLGEDDLDIIEISSTGDDEKPDLELDDCFDLESEEENSQMPDAGSAAEKLPDKQGIVSETPVSSRTSTETNNGEVILPKRLKDIYESAAGHKRNEENQDIDGQGTRSHHTVSDLLVPEPSIVPPRRKSVVSDTGRRDIDLRGNKIKDNSRQNSIIDDSTASKQQGCSAPVTENNQTTNPEAKKPTSIPLRRKTLAAVNQIDEDDLKKKSKNSARRKSLCVERKSTKSEILVSDTGRTGIDLPRNKIKDNSKQKSIIEDSTASKQQGWKAPRTDNNQTTNLEVKKPTSILLRRKTLAAVDQIDEDDFKKKSNNSSRRKSLGLERNSAKSEIVNNQKNDKLQDESGKKTENKEDKSKDSARVCSRRISINASVIKTSGKKDEKERSFKRKSLDGDSSNKNHDRQAKNNKEVIRGSNEKGSVHSHPNKGSNDKVSSRRSSIGSNDEKKKKSKRKSSAEDSSSKTTKSDNFNDDLIKQLERAIAGDDGLSPPRDVRTTDQISNDSKSDNKQKEPKRDLKSKSVQKNKPKIDSSKSGLLSLKVVIPKSCTIEDNISDMTKSNEHKKCDKHQIESELRASKPVDQCKHKKAKIVDSDEEFLINRLNSLGEKDAISKQRYGHNKDIKNDNKGEHNNISDMTKSNQHKKCDKQQNESESRGSKRVDRSKHKKMKVVDSDEEFLINRLNSLRDKVPKDDISNKSQQGYSRNKDKGENKTPSKQVRNLASKGFELGITDQTCSAISGNSGKSNTSTEKPVDDGDNFTSFKEPSLRNISVLETTFTTHKDNSVIIDITHDDDDEYDDMDFSCSQIFHMSQIVKSEIQDDTFQKIKNELAEMEFCAQETIINSIPIDLDDNMSGFENTQDICACLEDAVEENNDNLISNEENEELLQILGDIEQDIGNNSNTPDVEDMDVTLRPSPTEETSLTKIECSSFFGKSKYVKPPVIEPHTIVIQKKDLPKVTLPNKDTHVNIKSSTSNKRKNSLEAPSKRKKIKGSPGSVAGPPRCDTKSIHIEFKKRNSTSKQEDKLHKDNIREERRKKLKEITVRRSLPEVPESKSNKGKTVKVLPDSKTRRGSFLCEELKKNSDDTGKSKVQTRNSGSLRDLVASESGNKKDNPRRESKDASSHLLCKCREPGTSGHQLECPVHMSNLNNRDTIRESLNRKSDNEHHASVGVPPRRSKTPTNELRGYNLNPIDLAERSSRYNLRRTKSCDQIRPAQTRYNLRHSAAMEYNRNIISQDASRNNNMEHEVRRGNQGDSLVRHAAPLYPVNVTSRPPYISQGPQYASTPQFNHMATIQVAPHQLASRPTNELSRRLMWGNGGPSINRRPPVRRLPPVNQVVQKMVNWLPNWLTEQVNIDSSAPVNSPPARKIPLNFKNYDQYYTTFSKLILLENWQYLFKGFREGAEQPRKVKVEHVRVANDIMTMDCISYITQKELKQGLFYKAEDFVLLECVMNDKSNSYVSLSFGFIQRCKKTMISNEDVVSVRPDMRHVGSYCSGIPHTKLEFSMITRYQPGKEINMKKFPIVKLLANIRAHLMMIRAVKLLVESPICSKILYPKINEYRIAVTHGDIIQPHSLNTQQRTIVLEAASLCTGTHHGLYCIKGPPGTGKSTVIVNLVFQILFSHYVTRKTIDPPMILLAAPSNTAVDNLLAKLTLFKRNLPTVWDKYKTQIKCVRIGPESSISKDLIGYSLPKLAEKHIPIKHMDVPEFRAARERNENMLEFSKTFFGDRYGYEIKACEDLIIEKSNIICTTLNSCINGKLIDAVNKGLIKFSCCIIDEATQCHEVEALLPTILGISKLVLVGDPKQLNATIMNRDAFKLGFGDSLFSRIASNFTNDPRTPIKMLTDQYRMHPEICAFPNKHFYEGKLKSVPNPPNKLPEKIKPYLVFNCEKFSDGGEYTNIDEVNLIKKLLSTIFGMIDRNNKYTVGIITPYNAQKDLIGSSIHDLGSKNGNCKITVNTVDSFQGSENDIIIISCVRHSTNSFLQNENRLNVALTRAKQALYIIGNYTLFKECRPLYDLREDAKKRKLLLEIRQDPKTIDNFSKYLLKKNFKA